MTSTQSPWIKNKNFDLTFFHMPAIWGLLFIIPYKLYGPEILSALYLARSFMTGVPHLYTTWASVSPAFSRKNIRITYLYACILLAVPIGGAVYFFFTPELANVIMSLGIFWGGWHSHKQHLGFSKLYTHIQSRRWQDPTLLEDIKPLNWFMLLGLNTLFVYSFTREKIIFQLTDNLHLSLIYPKLPEIFLPLYLSVVACVGLWALYKTIYLRSVVGRRPLPLPQIILTATTVFIGMGLYTFLPPDGYWLVWTVPAVVHDIQYMAYAWLFESETTKISNAEVSKNAGFFAYASKIKSWPLYLMPLYLLTLFTFSLTFFGLNLAAMAIIQFITFFHYFADSFIWKKNFNTSVVPVTNLLISQNR